MHIFTWLWKKGILGNFLAGLIVLLPLFVTVALLSWVTTIAIAWFGAQSPLGKLLREVGLLFAAEPAALVIGWAILLGGIWLVGVAATTVGREWFRRQISEAIERVPLGGSIYRSVAQVVQLLSRDKSAGLHKASVVFCRFGGGSGVGLLGLQVSEKIFVFGGREWLFVYVPTSPMPMSGAIFLVPRDCVYPVNLGVDGLMQLYLSIGVLADAVVAPEYRLDKLTARGLLASECPETRK